MNPNEEPSHGMERLMFAKLCGSIGTILGDIVMIGGIIESVQRNNDASRHIIGGAVLAVASAAMFRSADRRIEEM